MERCHRCGSEITTFGCPSSACSQRFFYAIDPLHGWPYEVNAPPDPRDAEIARLKAEVAEALSRPDLGAGMVVVPRESIDEWRDLITDLVFDLGAHSRARKAVADLDALLKKGGG